MNIDKSKNLLTANLTVSQQSALNIIGALLVVTINTCINFFLSPYITEHLGVEANGYITLANNFISYFGLITTALDSMAGRFMLISIRNNDYKEANEYYSSVLFGDWILASILLIPVLVLIIKIDSFIQVSDEMLFDVQILFSLVFFNFFFSLCMPKWSNATYSTNKLYLRSIKTVITTIIRALLIYVAYKYLPPFAFYVALGGVVAGVLDKIIEYNYKKVLLPYLEIDKKDFRWKKIRILISSGIWNTVSNCGNILLEGLDILITNIFINSTMAGVLSLSKIVPNMINQIVGTIGTTFAPRLTQLFADNDYDGMLNEIRMQMKIVSSIANIPIGITIVLGVQFFSLWVPSQDAKMLVILATLTLLGMVFSGVSNCLLNVFTAANKLKLNSIVVIITGLLNVFVVFVLLRTTNLGVYAVAGVSSFVSIIRIFFFVAPYSAKCIKQKSYIFIVPLIKAGLNVIIPIMIGLGVGFIPGTGWFMFLIKCALTGFITLIIDFIFVFNKKERQVCMAIIRRN